MVDEFIKSGSIITFSPNQLLIGYGKRLDHSKTSFYFPDFFLQKQSFFSYENEVVISYDAFLSLFNVENLDFKIQWEPLKRNEFEEQFFNLKELIHRKELQKAVPYIFQYAREKVEPSLFLHLLKSALQYAKKYPAYLYGHWHDGEGVLGATPEVLFSKEELQVSTMALAGTSQLDSSLLKSQKDLSEHQIVVDALVKKLEKLGVLQKDRLKIVNVGTLFHLLTPISLKLQNEISFLDLVNLLHPTPALGTFPKNDNWLKQYDAKIKRDRFGAPVGFIKEKKASCYVAIRNIQWNKGELKIGAGVGVVQKSELSNEWQEIEAKMNAIKGIFNL